MKQRRVHSCHGAAVIVVTCCALLGAAAAAQATAAVTPPAATAAGSTLPASGATWGTPLLLPWSADVDVGAGVDQIVSLSCTAPGDCGVAGFYGDSSFTNQVFVDDEKSGRWQDAREIPGTATLNVEGAGVTAVSCASAGNCAVGGDYENASSNEEGFVANEVDGTWHDAASIRGTVSPYTFVNSVSCPAVGDCVAVGSYTNHAGHSQAFVADQSHGTWGSAITVAASLNVGGGAAVQSVACVSAGNCAAGGSYAVKGNDKYQAFTVDERHGVWSAAHEVAGALNTGANAEVDTISCASPGNCAAGGSYTDRAGHTQAFLVTEKGGRWSAAQEVARALNVGGNAIVDSVSCRSAGNCGAGGSYTAKGKGDTPNGARLEAFVVSERHGVWSAAREVAGALNIAGAAAVNTISCPNAGDCAAGGSYGIPNGLGHAFVVTERGGTWLAASEMAAKLDAGDGGSVDSISCISVAYCTAGGSINDAYLDTDSFVVTGAIIQPTSTTLSLSATRVSYGHEQAERLSVRARAKYSGTPTGKVIVKSGAATVCVIALKAGAGRCALSGRRLRVGTYHLTAAYTGSAGDLGSTSARKTLTVTG
jgi:Bacterial Ig-like domain (group 3)